MCQHWCEVTLSTQMYLAFLFWGRSEKQISSNSVCVYQPALQQWKDYNKEVLLGALRIVYFQIRNAGRGKELEILCLLYKHLDYSILQEGN